MIRKIFVCILAVLLITSSIHFEGLGPFTSNKVAAKKEINIPKTVEKVRELEELREPNTKTFINSDGTYTKEIYTEDIHFEEDGKLENISNTPEQNDEEDKGDFKYKNKDNRFSVKFAKDTEKKNLYKLKMAGETINVQLVNPKSTSAKSSKGIITYENIFENVDFKYSIGNSNVKEDIYLTKKDSARKFQFHIKTSLEPKKENGSINFYNKENHVAWVMIPPFMEDANGKYSEDITMDLKKSKNGYLVTIIPDSTFLDEEDTKYPVRIDPSVNIGGTSATTLDSYVMSMYSTNNYYNTPELRTGYTSSTGTTRTYMDFAQSLPNLAGKLLVKAELKVYKLNDIGSVSPTSLYANRITSPWDSTKVSYRTQPGIDTSVSYGSTSATGSARWLSLDLTSLVNGWMKGTYSNYGVVLRSTSEGSAGSYQKYYASESASGKPYLAITYSDPPGGVNAVPYSYKDGTGYVDLSWSPIEGVTGYKVQLFNGRGYESFNVGNTTSWTTRGKKLWPKRAQIDSGQYGLRTGGDGRELPENPNYLYVKSGGGYNNSTNYWFRVTGYNGYGETDIWGNGVVPVIPDQTKPTAPTAVQVTNDRINAFTIGWQPGTDLDGSGVAKYRVFMGDQPGVANIVSGQETTNLYYTYSGSLTPRKTYYAWVQAIDNSSNISDYSVPAEKMARKEFDAQIESYSIPLESNIDQAGAGENLWFDVRNTGTCSWTNDLNLSLSVTSTAPDGSAPTGFVGYLNPGEVVKPNEVKRFTVNWKPKTALIGSYSLKAVVGKGTDPTYINPPENIVNRSITVKDVKPPTGKITINENAAYTTNNNVTVKVFDVYDNASGDKFVQFANGPEKAAPSDLKFSELMPVPQSTQLFNWALKDQDGTQYVYAKFSDKSGNVSDLFSDSIILDRTLPEIKLTNVVNGEYVSGTKKIAGTITDQDLASYKLEYRNKSDQNAVWNLIAEKNTGVTDTTVAEWDTALLPKGEYELRISATDKAGQTNLVSKSVWIDKLDKKWTGSEGYYPTYPISLLDGTGFVNLYNGSLNMQEVDFSLPTRGFTVALGRTYASNLEEKGLLGKGWYANVEEHLVTSTNYVDYVDPDGTVHRFDRLPDGTFTTPAGTSYVLTLSDTKGYELTERNGSLSTKVFTVNGKLAKLIDTNGNTVVYQYDNNLLTKVTSLTKSYSLKYNPDSTIESATFSTGEKVSYSYSDGYLTDAKLYTKSGKLSSTTHYDYENGKMKDVVSENGLKVEFVFNGNRLMQTKTKRSTRVVDGTKKYPIRTYEAILDTLSYNLTTNKIYATTNSINENKTSKNLANTEYELNSEGNLWKQNIIRTFVENEDPAAANQDQNNILITTDYEKNRVKTATDAQGNKTTFEYDNFGNVVKQLLPAVTTNGSKSTYALENKYNEKGQITHAYNTLGQAKQWKYDAKGNVSQIIDEEGNNQYFDYDSYGNVTKTKSDRGPLYSYMPDYSMENKTLMDWKVQGAASKVTTQAKSGKQSIELAPNGILQTGTIAIKKGRLPVQATLESIAPSGAVTSEVKLQFLKDDTIVKDYTVTNPITTSWNKYRVNGAVPTDATHVRVQVTNKGSANLYVDDLVLEESTLETKYVYDSTGENVKEKVDPYGSKTSYTYNEYGQALTETNALNQTQSIVYDEEQRIKEKKDRVGRINSFVYDDMGNVIKEINSLGQETTYEYNEWGQLVYKKMPAVKLTTYKNETVDQVEEKQAKLYTEYDELGRKVKETDENGYIIAQEFDGYGRVARSIDPMQNQKYFAYDKNGNILHTIDYAAKDSPDGRDKLLIAKGEMFATFDEWNRQVTETDNTGNRNVLTMTNTYDSENHLVHTKDAEGTEFHYTFNALDENIYSKDNSTPTVETWSYYDGLGTPAITISGSTIEFAITDANGNQLETVDHKGTKTKFEYNEVGDKVKQTNPDGTTTEWTYNQEGQILTETQKVEEKDGKETYLVTNYVYNDAAEVTKQTVKSKVYDKETKETSTAVIKDTDLTYDELGRLVRELSNVYQDGDPATPKKSDVRFLYDLNGNLIRKWIYDESSKTVLNQGATTYPFVRSETIYQYDANNRFTYEEKVENGIVTRKTYKDDENAEMIQSALGVTTVQYNANDLAEKVITPRSEPYQFSYTASESINMIKGPRISVNMDYGLNEKMTAIHAKKKDTPNDLFFENYTYNADEHIETATNPWDGQKAYTYTPEGFLKTVKKGTETLAYSYDTSGNLLKKVNETGKLILDNKYGQGNRITSSIQYDAAAQKYKKVTYSFRPDGSLLQESISKAVDTVEAAATAAVEMEKEYNYASINLLIGITTKTNGKVTEKIEFTYDSENKRTSKKVTTDTSERTEFYYYDANGDLVSISQKSGIDQVENLLNFYRDASGQLLSFEYKGKIYDYVYNQRGDIVAITNELAEIIARYSYDEWGNLLKIDAPTDLGKTVANANPFRYVGKFGVQYDNNTKLYYMGWRDYDAKIGRYLVADEYEGEDTNPISFNRYLYAESDPVNNIDPDGYAPKWLKKVTKGVKKTAKAAYNFAIGDDIKTLTSKNTKWYQKAGAAISIASNFVPGGGVVSKVAKAAIKGTSMAVKAVKATKAVAKAVKVVKAPAKKVASVINIKPKTVPALSIKSTPRIQSTAPARVSSVTPQAKPKVSSSSQPSRGNPITRVNKNNDGERELLLKLDLQLFTSKGTGKTYQTYTKTNPKTGEVYTGRTSGTGTPLENIAKRDANHHMNKEGFGPAIRDKSSTNKDAIRGREQQLIDLNGGAKSTRGTSGNKINGISDSNPNKQKYIDAANKEW